MDQRDKALEKARPANLAPSIIASRAASVTTVKRVEIGLGVGALDHAFLHLARRVLRAARRVKPRARQTPGASNPGHAKPRARQ